MSAFPLLTRPGWQCTAEVFDFGLVLHCSVESRWTKELRNDLMETFETFLRVHNKPVFAAWFMDESPKIRKFAEMLGFKPECEVFAPSDGRKVLLLRR